MRPHPQNSHGLFFFKHLVYKPVLDADSSGIGAAQVAEQFFKRRRILKRIVFKYLYQLLSSFFQTAFSEPHSVLGRLLCKHDTPHLVTTAVPGCSLQAALSSLR